MTEIDEIHQQKGKDQRWVDKVRDEAELLISCQEALCEDVIS